MAYCLNVPRIILRNKTLITGYAQSSSGWSVRYISSPSSFSSAPVSASTTPHLLPLHKHTAPQRRKMASENSRVIIVGGGPVGLTAALGLYKAGIDFVLLEGRSEVVAKGGSDLMLQAVGMRALGQLDLYKPMCDVSFPVDEFLRHDHNRKHLGDMLWFDIAKRDFGVYPRMITRTNLLKTIYEGLPEEARAKCLPNKKLSNITIEKDKVIASCKDGTSYAGSLVIGADGIHSAVRRSMETLRNVPTVNEKDTSPFLTTFRAIWIRFPTSLCKSLRSGQAIETHAPGASTQLFVSDEETVVALYERLEKPVTNGPRYTEADIEPIINKWAHLPLLRDGSITIGEAYKGRKDVALVNLEEGVVKQWTLDDRIALVGDAAHKFTPSTGQGCNFGIIDVVVLVNALNKVKEDLAGSDSDSDSDAATLALEKQARVSRALKAYQAARHDAVVKGCAVSGRATLSSTWSGMVMKFLDQYVMPYQFAQRIFAGLATSDIASSPRFDFIQKEESFSGKVPWVVSQN